MGHYRELSTVLILILTLVRRTGTRNKQVYVKGETDDDILYI